MIALLLVVCLVDNPAICAEHITEIPPGASCLVNGQEIASVWLQEHPLWKLKGWRCQFGERGRDA